MKELQELPYDESKVFSACVCVGSIVIGGMGLFAGIICHLIK